MHNSKIQSKPYGDIQSENNEQGAKLVQPNYIEEDANQTKSKKRTEKKDT